MFLKEDYNLKGNYYCVGPVTAGIVGLVMMPKYSLFGDTLITASQIENTSLGKNIFRSLDRLKFINAAVT